MIEDDLFPGLRFDNEHTSLKGYDYEQARRVLRYAKQNLLPIIGIAMAVIG